VGLTLLERKTSRDLARGGLKEPTGGMAGLSVWLLSFEWFLSQSGWKAVNMYDFGSTYRFSWLCFGRRVSFGWRISDPAARSVGLVFALGDGRDVRASPPKRP